MIEHDSPSLADYPADASELSSQALPSPQAFEPSSQDAELSSQAFELSPQQARWWQWRQWTGGTDARARLTLAVAPNSDHQRLRIALNRVAARHEILRTEYRSMPGISLPVQIIRAHADLASTLKIEGSESVTLELPAAHLDTASVMQLAQQWAMAYLGEDSAELPLQYADYAAWRQELVENQSQAQAFWEGQLAAVAPVPFLPLRRHMPDAGIAADTGVHELDLSPHQWHAVHTLAHRLDISPANAVLTAWTILLYQHTAGDRMTLGLDWQVRDAEVGDALGLFSELLPLTLEGLDDLTGTELCQQLAQRSADLKEWRDYFPSQRAGTSGINPWALGFRMVQATDRQQPFANALIKTGWRVAAADSPTAPCQLLLEFRAGAQTDQLLLHYNRHLYDQQALALFEDQLLTLLEDLTRQPERKLAEFHALSRAEQQRVMAEFAVASPPASLAEKYQAVAALPQLAACFARQIIECPNAPAIKAASGELSYKQLDEQAGALAARLCGAGAQPGTRIGHFLTRDLEAVVAVLAIFKAGGVYVPIDPDYPQNRIDYILQNCQAELVATRGDLVAQLPLDWQQASRLVLVDRPGQSQEQVADAERQSGTRQSEARQPGARQPGDEAYLIYTSGSTGDPKGVVITHANALHSLAARLAYYPEPVQRFLLLSSFAFDSSIAGLFWTLAQGGCLHLVSEAEQKDPARLTRIIAAERITHLLALPSLYQLILHELDGKEHDLRAAIVAGENCTRALVNRHHAQLPSTHLYNEYGPTEASVWTTVAECQPGADALPVPIGHPIPHSKVWLLDDDLAPVARGLKGEIFIGGPGLSPGYLNRPDLSVQRFVLRDGERLYRTGDHAFWNEHGELVFLGRADAQVKIRGYRIELGEIETKLQRLVGSDPVAVMAVSQPDGSQQLRAFIESSADRPTEHLRDQLGRQLPAYMVPSEILILERFPVTANGKVDKNALMQTESRRLRAPYVPPQTALQQILADVWQDLLGVDRVGLNDDFFALGGHSLLVVRLTHAIKTKLGAEVPVALVFQNPRLAQLAERLAALGAPDFIFTLNAGTAAKPPLFCLHQPSGEVHHYQPLVDALGGDQPVYGITLPAGRNSDNSSLDQLAVDYCRALRALQPAGPYYLCGWSLGGVLALAVANEIERTGEEVAFLAVVDSTLKDNDTPLSPDQLQALYAEELTGESRRRFDEELAREWAQLAGSLTGLGRYEQWRYLLVDWTAHHHLQLAAAPEVVAFALETMRHARRWVRAYQPPVLRCPIIGWWADDTLAGDPDLIGHWSRLYGHRLRRKTVPGHHDGLLQEPLFQRQFSGALEQAQAARQVQP